MEKYFPWRTRPVFDPLLACARSRFARSREGGRVPRAATSFEQFDGNQSSEKESAEREEEQGENALSLAGGTYGHLVAQWREFKSASRYASHSLA